MKVCKKCYCKKPLEQFSFQNKEKGYYNSWCKSCHKTYIQHYYNCEEKKQLKREYNKRFYKDHKFEIKKRKLLKTY